MDEMKPYVVVIIIQLVYTGMYVISKAAFNSGVSTYVFIFYRQAAATILLVPLAVVLERKKAPPLSFMVLFKVFMTALVGITFSLNVYNVALSLTSATVASATSNSIPVITFFLAVLLRMETVTVKTLPGMAKVFGIVLCVAGIASISFITNPHINPLNIHHPFAYSSNHGNHVASYSKTTTWITGTFLMILGNAAWSLWIVLQGLVLKEYPSKLLFTTLQCFFSAIQSFFVALAFERNTAQWKIKFDTGLLAIAYCGFVVTGVAYYLQAWCIEKKGPVFLAIFSPLVFAFTVFLSSFLLGEVISLGSVLGGILMVMGLYSVLWGKSRENGVVEALIEEGKVVLQPIEEQRKGSQKN